MNPSPFFSIVTSCLNSRQTLSKTLSSVSQQTYRGFEHIVIDGGSTDGSLHVLKDYALNANFQWRSESDRGISHALNKGLRLARGRYVLILHGDDRLMNDLVLSNVYEDLKNMRVDICSYPVFKEQLGGNWTLYRPIRFVWWHHFKGIFPHQGCFVHRKVFDRIGPFRESLKIAMDYDFFYRALSTGATVRFGTCPVAIMGGDGLSSDNTMLRERLREEALVHKMNENRLFWRMLQRLFRLAYLPYKIFPLLNTIF